MFFVYFLSKYFKQKRAGGFMNYIYKGYAGSGKSTTLINKAYEIIEKDALLPSEILILTLTPQEKEVLNCINNERETPLPLNILFIESFCSSIINKSFELSASQMISDDQGSLIINALSKKEFVSEPNMMSLTKSTKFSRELHNLFGRLKNNSISDKSFFKLIDNSKVPARDKIRLYLVANVYARYNEYLHNNKFIDYRDLTQNTLNILNTNHDLMKHYQNSFKFIFIDGFQNISPLQLELIKLISNNNLFIFTDAMARIHEFKGASPDNNDLDFLNSVFADLEFIKKIDIHRNTDILNRALFLIDNFADSKREPVFSESKHIQYIEFEDIESEIAFIAKEIYEKVISDNLQYSDFAIIVRDVELRHKFIDLFKTCGLPVNSELSHSAYSNFKTSLIRYLNICNLLEKLNLDYFNPHELDKISIESRADFSDYLNELNLYFENILNTLLENVYHKQKLLQVFESLSSRSLINVVNWHKELLPENDQLKVENEFKKIYKLYKLFKERKILEFTGVLLKHDKDIILDPLSSKFTGRLLSNISSILELQNTDLLSSIDLSVIINAINATNEELSINNNAVNLVSAFRVIGKEYKYVFLPGLTEKTFPKKYKNTLFISPEGNEVISNELRKSFPYFKSLIESDEDSFSEEVRLVYLSMTRAKEQLILSTHQYNDKKQVQPSIFFSLLKENDSLNVVNNKKCNDNKPEDPQDISGKKSSMVSSSESKTVLDDNEIIELSASSISNYLRCPRKYFYRKLMGLKEETTVEANYGLIAHVILEVFNNTCQDDYTSENLLNLTDIYFNSINNPEAALEKGFKKKDLEMLKSCLDLNLNVMKENLLEAIKLMESNYYFEKPFEEIETEKTFEFTLDQLENVHFKSRVDAIFKTSEGFKVIDYKTGANKKDLSYFVSDYGVRFEGDYGQYKGKFSENNIKKYEYQVPLYYFALQNDEKYKDRINKLGLMYIRPAAKDNGYKQDLIEAAQIEAYKDEIVNNISKTVITPIRESKSFKADNASDFSCEYCSFKILCDRKEDDDEQ